MKGILKKLVVCTVIVLAIISKAFCIRVDSSAIVKHSFNEAEWRKTTAGLDYSKEKENNPSNSSSYHPFKNFNFSISGTTAKIILFTLAIALLVYLLVRILAGNLVLWNKKVPEAIEFSEENSAEDIHSSNLEKLYEAAIRNNNFREAIRIYYLIVLRELTTLQFIRWKKDKTNSEYVFEMREHPAFSTFQEITLQFEKAWYGDAELNQLMFQSVNPKFESFISEIRNPRRPEPSSNGTQII